MQVALGRTGDYAVRVLLDLARHYGKGRRKAREIAEAMDVPHQYLARVMTPFVRKGVVATFAGRDGGYVLAVAPRDLTLLDVIETAEGPLESGECTLRGGPCDWTGPCPVHETWVAARDQLSAFLREVTIEELASRDADIELGCAPPAATPVHLRPTARRGVRAQPEMPAFGSALRPSRRRAPRDG